MSGSLLVLQLPKSIDKEHGFTTNALTVVIKSRNDFRIVTVNSQPPTMTCCTGELHYMAHYLYKGFYHH